MMHGSIMPPLTTGRILWQYYSKDNVSAGNVMRILMLLGIGRYFASAGAKAALRKETMKLVFIAGYMGTIGIMLTQKYFQGNIGSAVWSGFTPAGSVIAR